MGTPAQSKSRGYRDPLTGVFFGSRKEYNRWRYLQAEHAQGRIQDLHRGAATRLRLYVNGVYVGYYTPDAAYTRDGKAIVEDVKGQPDRGWAFRKRVIEAACQVAITEIRADNWTDAKTERYLAALQQEAMAL